MNEPVPPEVLRGLARIRLSGETNMLDRIGVMTVAYIMGELETMVWVNNNKKIFGQVIMSGEFLLEEES